MKDQGKLMSLLAFVALITTAVIQVIVFIVGLFDGNADLGVLVFIANILLTVVVVWVGWQYAKDKSNFWKILFAIVAILALLGAIGVQFF